MGRSIHSFFCWETRKMISCPTKLISVQICTGKKRATHVKVRPLFSPSNENKKNQAILFVDRVPILVNALTAGTTPCMRVYVRNRTLTLIEREDDTRSWGNFLVYFSHSTTMSYPPRGWGYILIGC
jgi:hypothetical protein